MKDINNEAINFNTSCAGPGVGPSPLVRNFDIRNIQIDGVPNAIVMNGLPEKWIENIQLGMWWEPIPGKVCDWRG